MTFASALVSAWTAKSAGSRPLASEAVAAVLLDRARVTPADVEVGRVMAYAEEEVQDAMRLLVHRIWPDRYVGAAYYGVGDERAAKKVVFADEGDLADVSAWMGVAGEFGAGVLMTARSADNAHEAYRLWASLTVRLDPVDADGVIPAVVQLVTGQRPSSRRNLRGIRLSDLRSGLGPRDVSERAIDVAVQLRDQRERGVKAAEAQAAIKAEQAEKAMFEKATAATHERDTPLSKLSGFGPARAWGLEVAEDLRAYRNGELAWADCDRGVLLSGPPGVGKTRFARALASEAEAAFYPSSFGALCQNGASGSMVEKNLKKLFDEARRNAPSVVFLDEMDSVPTRESAIDHNTSYFTAVNNAFLEALDGSEPRNGVLVIAASNHPDRIDPAMRRPGRLDRHIAIPLPTVEDLMGIIRHHLGTDLPADYDPQFQLAARACRGMSPADVEQACRDARRHARRVLGRDKALPGDVVNVMRDRRGQVSPRLERLVAVHEAGHAVAAVVLGIDIEYVDADRQHTSMRTRPNPTAAMVEAEMAMMLAGRAAEAVLIGEVSTGAKHDLAMVTKTAVAFHAEFGFGEETGLLTVDVRVLDGWSPMHAAVKALVDRTYAHATELMTRHRDNVDRVAAALDRNRYLDAAEVKALMRQPLASLARERGLGRDPVPMRAPGPARVGHGWGPRLVRAA